MVYVVRSLTVCLERVGISVFKMNVALNRINEIRMERMIHEQLTYPRHVHLCHFHGNFFHEGGHSLGSVAGQKSVADAGP